MGLPSLRQPLPILENENNSSLQIYMLDYLYKCQISFYNKQSNTYLSSIINKEHKELAEKISKDNTLLVAFYEMFTHNYLDSNYDENQLAKINSIPILRLLRLVIITNRYICLLTCATLKENLEYYSKYYNDIDGDQYLNQDEDEDNDDEDEFKDIYSTFNYFNHQINTQNTLKEKQEKGELNNYFTKEDEMRIGYKRFKKSSKKMLLKHISSMHLVKDKEELRNREIGYYLILNCYNKAYKAYISTINYLDEYLIDLNIAIRGIENKLNEILGSKKSRVTFSVYRVFMHSWFNLVLNELLNTIPSLENKNIKSNINTNSTHDYSVFNSLNKQKNMFNTLSEETFKDSILLDFPEFTYINNVGEDKRHREKLKTVIINKDCFNYQIKNQFSMYNNYNNNNNTKKCLTPNTLVKSCNKQLQSNSNTYINKIANNNLCKTPNFDNTKNNNGNLNTIYKSNYINSSYTIDPYLKSTYFYKSILYLTKRIMIKSLEKYIEKNNSMIETITSFNHGNNNNYNSNNNNNSLLGVNCTQSMSSSIHIFLSKNHITPNSKINFKNQDKLNQFFINYLNVEWFEEFSLLQDIINSFIDSSCTELKVFKLNLSSFSGKLYSFIEKILLQVYDNVFRFVFKGDLNSYKDFLSNEDLYKSFPKCTKKKIEEMAVSYFLKQTESSLHKAVIEYAENELKCSSSYIKSLLSGNMNNSNNKGTYLKEEQTASELRNGITKKKFDTSAKVFLTKALSSKSQKLASYLKLLLEDLDIYIKKKAETSNVSGSSNNVINNLSLNHNNSNSLNYYNNFIKNNNNFKNKRNTSNNFTNSSIFNSSLNNSSFGENSNNSYENNNSNLNIESTNANNTTNSLLNNNISINNVTNNNTSQGLNLANPTQVKPEIENFTYFIFVNYLYNNKELSMKLTYLTQKSRIIESLDFFLDYDQDLYKINDDSVNKELKRRNILALMGSMSPEETEFMEEFTNELKSRDDIIRNCKSNCFDL